MNIFNYYNIDLVGINNISVVVRLLLATVISGAIGLERGSQRHQAGMRTHILVCIGASIVMMTNQYIVQTFNVTADPARLGAQVISGIGFIGAGLILVTRTNRVKGLTTAAGLWACACIGLATGIGFYSGAIAGGLIVLFVLAVLPLLEDFLYSKSKVMELAVKIKDQENTDDVIECIKNQDIKIIDINTEKQGLHLAMKIKIPDRKEKDDIINKISSLDCVTIVLEKD